MVYMVDGATPYQANFLGSVGPRDLKPAAIRVACVRVYHGPTTWVGAPCVRAVPTDTPCVGGLVPTGVAYRKEPAWSWTHGRHACTYQPSSDMARVGKAEHAGADHGGDVVEGGVPPLGVPRGVDGEPVVGGLLLLRGGGQPLRVRAPSGCQREAVEIQRSTLVVLSVITMRGTGRLSRYPFLLHIFICDREWTVYLCSYIERD
jgi:hypothetical protein